MFVRAGCRIGACSARSVSQRVVARPLFTRPWARVAGIGLSVGVIGTAYAHSELDEYGPRFTKEPLKWIKRKLDRIEPATLTFASLCGINLGVWVLWRVNPTLLMRHATVSWENVRAGRIHTLVTAAFSHIGIFHLGMNMMPLYLLGQFVEESIGRRDYLEAYLLGGVASSLASLVWFAVVGLGKTSLGASGAVIAVVVIGGRLAPDQMVGFLGVPVTFTMDQLVLYGIYCFNVVGMLAARYLPPIDWAGHLGGALAGDAYFHLRYSSENSANLTARRRVMREERQMIREARAVQEAFADSAPDTWVRKGSRASSFYEERVLLGLEVAARSRDEDVRARWLALSARAARYWQDVLEDVESAVRLGGAEEARWLQRSRERLAKLRERLP